MADTNPLAIRVSEDIKVNFNKLAEAGNFENKGEFLKQLLVLYQLEAIKKEATIMRPAIEAAEMLSTRLLEVLNGTAAALLTKDEKDRQELQETKTQMQERILELQCGRNNDAERILGLETQLIALQAEVNRLESVISDKSALLKAQGDNVDTNSKLDNLLKLLAAKGSKVKFPSMDTGNES